MQKKLMAAAAKLLIVNFGKSVVESLRSQVDARVQESHEWLEPLVVDGAFPDAELHRRAGEADVLLVAGNLEGLPSVDALAKVDAPMVMADPPLAFHSFQAPLRHQLQRRGVTMLPADDAARLGDSFRAVAARRWLRSSRVLLCTPPARHAAEAATWQAMDLAARQRLGVEVVRRPVSQLQERAAEVPERQARDVLDCWRKTLVGTVDAALPESHLLDVARLYVAEESLLAQTGANSLGVEEFESFLRRQRAMPNVTYVMLKERGVTCTEEADLSCLLTELLLVAVHREQVTMSNIYTAYRDEFEKHPKGPYTPENQRRDFEQCRSEQCAVIAHFSTAGSLPRNMMEGERYDILETLPAWPGQSMVHARPQKKPVLLGRLWEQCEQFDLFGPCPVVDVRENRDCGWYRGRWLVRLPDFATFVAKAIHTHYAIALNKHPDALRTLVRQLLKIPIGPRDVEDWERNSVRKCQHGD